MKKSLMIHFSATEKFDEVDYYFKTVIRSAILTTLEYMKVPYDADVSVTLCDNAYIRRLNKQYREPSSSSHCRETPIALSLS